MSTILWRVEFSFTLLRVNILCVILHIVILMSDTHLSLNNQNVFLLSVILMHAIMPIFKMIIVIIVAVILFIVVLMIVILIMVILPSVY